jgi:hypothetical protein
MPSTINGTTGFGGNLTGNVTGNVTGTASAIANGAVSAAKLDGGQTGSAPIYGCRAWVNFDGMTGAIRGQGNVSAVTRNAVGNYTVSFATTMTDTNYAVIATADNPESTTTTWSVGPIFQDTGGVQLLVQNSGGVNNDRATVSVAIFR